MKTKRKNIFKSLLALTLALIMVLGVAPISIMMPRVSAGAGIPDTTVSGEYEYFMTRQQKACLIKTKVSSDGTAEIPEKVDGFDVECVSLEESKVKQYWVSDNNKYLSAENGVLFNKDKTELIQYPSSKSETTYVVPDTVINLDYGSINNPNLKSITLGAAVEYGADCLNDCPNLESINVNKKNNHYIVYNGVLYSKDKTNLVCIPRAREITTLSIPDSVDYLTINSQTLKKLTIGSNVKYIYSLDCPNLESIAISNSNKYLSVENSVLYNKDKTELIKYPAKKVGTSFNVPSGVISIGEGAFKNCSKIESVVFPNTLKIISENAFENCSGLKSVTIPGSAEKYIEAMCGSSEDIGIIDQIDQIVADSAFANCTALTDVTILNRLSKISPSAFANCTNIKHITFKGCADNKDPNQENAYIETSNYNGFLNVLYAINRIAKLESITIDGSDVDYIVSDGVLYNKDKTKLLLYPKKKANKAVIPADVTSIGDYAFANCTDLTQIVFPSTLTSIGEDAFRNCIGLTQIAFPNELISIDENAFRDCTGLTRIILPNTLTSIGVCAFRGCANLTQITLPRGVKFIGSGAFEDCAKLSNIFAADDGEILGIGYDVFKGTPYYNDSKNWSGSILYLGNYILDIRKDFSGKVSIKDGTICIAAGVFYSCKNITEIYIPASLKSLSIGLGLSNGNLFALKQKISCDVNPFIGCCSLEAINVSSSNEKYSSDRGVLYDSKKTYLIHFPQNSKIESYKVLDGVSIVTLNPMIVCDTAAPTKILESFLPRVENIIKKNDDSLSTSEGYKNLRSIILPSSTRFFSAGNEINNLQSISVDSGNSVYSSENGVLFNKDKTKLEYYPIGKTDESYTVPASVTSAQFSYCQNLKQLNIGANVSSLDISDCASLNKVNVSEKNETYFSKDGALYRKNCEDTWDDLCGTELIRCNADAVDFVVDDETVSIAEGAFSNCLKLKSITIPNSVKSIASDILKNAESLPEIYYSGTEKDWDSIKRSSYNDKLLKCNIHYNWTGEHVCKNKKLVTIPAQCEVNGMSYYICTECGKQMGEATVIPATGHSWGEWKVTKAATTSSEGSRERVCSVCSKKETEVIPVLAQTVKDDKSGIEISAPSGSYDGELELEVEEIFDGESFQIVSAIDGQEQSKIYDVTTKVNGKETQPGSTVTVRIPLPEGYDPARTYVYHVNSETGEVENMNARYEDGCLVFETDHFSAYAVVQIKAPKKDSIFKKILNVILAPFRAIINLFKKLFGK